MSQRMKCLRIDVEGLVNGGVLSGVKPALQLTGIPTDAKFVSMDVSFLRRNILEIYLESDEWDIVPSGQMIPYAECTIHYVGEPLSKLQPSKTSSRSIVTTEHVEEPKHSSDAETKKSYSLDRQDV